MNLSFSRLPRAIFLKDRSKDFDLNSFLIITWTAFLDNLRTELVVAADPALLAAVATALKLIGIPREEEEREVSLLLEPDKEDPIPESLLDFLRRGTPTGMPSASPQSLELWKWEQRDLSQNTAF